MWGFVLVASSCVADPTEVVVYTYNNVDLSAAEPAFTHVRFTAEAGGTPGSRAQAVDATSFPLTLDVEVPDDVSEVRITVEALRVRSADGTLMDADAVIVAEQLVQTVRGEAVYVEVSLDPACRDTICAPGLVCDRGRCVSPAVVEGVSSPPPDPFSCDECDPSVTNCAPCRGMCVDSGTELQCCTTCFDGTICRERIDNAHCGRDGATCQACRCTGCRDGACAGRWSQIAVDKGNACGITSDGDLRCTADGLLPPTPIRDVARIGTAQEMRCAVVGPGRDRVVCWGRNGAEEANAQLTAPVEQIAVAGEAWCARTEAGEVTCRGGGESFFSENPLADFPNASRIRFLVGQNKDFCALGEQSDLYCWGQDGVVDAGRDWEAVAVSFQQYVCGIRFDATLNRHVAECWGSNPPDVSDLRPTAPFAIAAEIDVCVLTDGRPTCVGDTDDDFPSDVSFLSLHGESDGVCAMASDGYVFCAGATFGGIRGDWLCHDRSAFMETN